MSGQWQVLLSDEDKQWILDEMHVFLQIVVPKRYKTLTDLLYPQVAIDSSTRMLRPDRHLLDNPEVNRFPHSLVVIAPSIEFNNL